ncbi:MAG TPA: PQQ-binding-like beta-propeller repeat protein [Puia sp.]|nr:PQQ-binding-like beta-propeller repeat protein [Puia sp.]
MRKVNLFLGISFLIIIFSFVRNTDLNKTELPFKATNKFQDTLNKVGKRIFNSYCQICHNDSASSLAPSKTILSAMTPRAVFASLNFGKMRQQGSILSETERKAVAQWVTNSILKTTDFNKEAYTNFSIPNSTPFSFDHSGWGNNKEGTGFRTAAQAGISANNVASLKLKWTFVFPDATIVRSKPAVIGNWLIVGGQYGEVFALNRKTGKIGWIFTANAGLRGAISVVQRGNAITAFFADFSTNVFAVNVRTGKMIWNKRAGFDPQSTVTGSVQVYDEKVFVPISSIEVANAADGNFNCCTSSGGVVALDAKTGNEIWRYRVLPKAKETGKKKNGKPFYGPAGAPVWCSPTVDVKRGLLYIGTGENYSDPSTNTSDAVQAIDIKTGKLVWNFQGTNGDTYNLACPVFNNCPAKPGPDLDFGMAPIIVKRNDGKDILVAGQKSGVVYALTPQGKLIWKTKIGKGGMLGGVHWGMATDGKYVYAANADNSIAVDKKDTTKPTPGLYALDLNTGRVIWKTPTPDCGQGCLLANSAAPLVIPGLVFAGALDGHIRAYSAKDGKILWDFNTAKEFETSYGMKGKGGALDGPAPVIADGMLFVNSGYGMFGEMPGNVLLAFEVEKK